jgi:lysyl-tRNA synthetase class 2
MNDNQRWQPTASIKTLQQRAKLIAQIRQYFETCGVWEVETPVLSHFGGTDVNLEQWQTDTGLTLHTSPEFAMKRLLAAGSGDIYQICRAFRRDEAGQRHNAEFSMLEWYRTGMDEHALIQDVAMLIRQLCPNVPTPITVRTYAEAFLLCDLPHPLIASEDALKSAASDRLNADVKEWSRDDCLDALMSFVVEPALPADQLCFVHQYPASQAALANFMMTEHGAVGRRFELYWHGMELANGYCELTDVQEQKRRFEADNRARLQQGKETMVQDERFLAALEAGLPSCAGVALGLDRLLMIILGKDHIQDVMAFPFDRA